MRIMRRCNSLSFQHGDTMLELSLRDGRKVSIDCTGIEDVLDVTMAQQTELDYPYYGPHYADLILERQSRRILEKRNWSHGQED